MVSNSNTHMRTSMANRRRALLGFGVGTVAMPFVARAEKSVTKWRCATAWSKNLVGPGVSARRLAERIKVLTAGALDIEIFAAGEIVPALQTFDAVSSGAVEMAHTASLFWGGKLPVAPLFTTVPLGPGPTTHLAWLLSGGQALWDELYAPHKLKPFVGGNTGPSAAGWFRREVKTLEDLKGLRIRATGLGGELYSRLGATAIALSPSDTYPAFERGVVDAVELLAPANDAPLGFNRIAPYYVFPGFNKPNGASEVLIGQKAWDSLPNEIKVVVGEACNTEYSLATAEAFAANTSALEALVATGTKVGRLPEDVLAAAFREIGPVLDRVRASGALADRIVSSLKSFVARGRNWHQVSQGPSP